MKHLIFVQHGMFGMSYFFDNFKKSIEKSFHDSIVILPHKNNFLYSTFGIKICGDKLLSVVEETISLHPDAISISFIGHSFGGILIRYVIGMLEEEGVFEKINPLAYVAISTPHTGVETDRSIIKFLLRGITGTTGKELIGHLPTLKDLSVPDSIFVKGLEKFQLKLLYGNLVNDIVIAQIACLCNIDAQRDLIEIVPKRLYVVNKNINENIEESVDHFHHIKKINWIRKVINLPEYSSSHIAIVGRHTYIPFFQLKTYEGSIVLTDIISEIQKHIHLTNCK